MKTLIQILFFILIVNSVVAVPSEVLKFDLGKEPFTVEKITDGHGIIWSMEFLSPSKIIFSEKNGRLNTLDLKSQVVRELKNPPKVLDSGQGGLLDVALHPDYKNNSWVYVTYAKKIGNLQTTVCSRARLDEAQESFGTWEDIFIAKPTLSTTHHYGSRMTFDKNDHIFISVGERGNADLSQSLEAHMGKIIRLNTDGTVPSDNPFIGTPKAKPEIWSYGHRNPQGIYFDISNNILYNQEHGPKGGDEINIVEKGKNYGWPVISWGVDYSGTPINNGLRTQTGMEQPIKYFAPSIAPSSFFVYQNGSMKFFNNKFISGALALQHINILDVKDAGKACEDRVLEKLGERFRDVIQGPDGFIYTSSDNGRIYRIKPGKK